MKLKNESRSFLSIICILILSIPIVFYTPPESFDLFRHYEVYDIYQSTQKTEYLKSYVGLTYLMQILTSLGLPAQAMVFLCSYVFLFTMFRFIFFVSSGLDNDNKNKWSFSDLILVVTPFLIFDYISLMSGLRFSFAVSFFILAALADYKKNNKISVIYHILAVSFHFSLCGLVFLFFLSKKIQFKQTGVTIVLFILGLIFSQFIALFSKYINDAIAIFQLSGDWAYKADIYLFGEWGTNATQALNVNGIAMMYLKKLLTYMLFFVFLCFRVIVNPAHNNDFVKLCIVSLAFLSSFYTLSGRFESVVICFLFLPIGMKLVALKKLRYYEWTILILIFVRGAIQYVNIREEYARLLMLH